MKLAIILCTVTLVAAKSVNLTDSHVNSMFEKSHRWIKIIENDFNDMITNINKKFTMYEIEIRNQMWEKLLWLGSDVFKSSDNNCDYYYAVLAGQSWNKFNKECELKRSEILDSWKLELHHHQAKFNGTTKSFKDAVLKCTTTACITAAIQDSYASQSKVYDAVIDISNKFSSLKNSEELDQCLKSQYEPLISTYIEDMNNCLLGLKVPPTDE